MEHTDHLLGYGGPMTAVQIYNDFAARRAAFIKALTDDYNVLLQCLDEDTHQYQRVMGHANGWEVLVLDNPGEVLEALKPPLCNYDMTHEFNKNLVMALGRACHIWILTVASYFARRSALGEADRQLIATMISQLPTISSVVNAYYV